jgi:transmembrane sensor
MSDNRILQLLARKLANEATADELSELQDLLDQYPDGLYYEEFLKQLWAKPAVNETDTEIAYQLHKLKYADEFKPSVSPNPVSSIYSKSYKYLAGVLTCLLLSVGIFYSYKKNINQAKAVLNTQIFAGKGIRKKVTLPDGTQVWLNSNSKLNFNDDLNAQTTRIVHLEGEAYFSVTKNKHKPFIIYTKQFSIKVLGTVFNVKAYPGDRTNEAALLHGSIELTVLSGQKQKIMLKPNEKFIMTGKATSKTGLLFQDTVEQRNLSIQSIKPVEIQSQQYTEETAWLDNRLVFKNETFDELAPRLERWYNVNIHIENAAINGYHFTGIFQNESLDQALKAMQLIKPFKYKINNDEVTID